MSKYLEGITKEMIESQGYLYDEMSPIVIDMKVVDKTDKNAIRMLIKDKSGKEKIIDGEDQIKKFLDDIKSKSPIQPVQPIQPVASIQPVAPIQPVDPI